MNVRLLASAPTAPPNSARRARAEGPHVHRGHTNSCRRAPNTPLCVTGFIGHTLAMHTLDPADITVATPGANAANVSGISARIEARDRRLAAVHEAAHVVIARRVRVEAAAWIFRRPTADPRREKTWGGQTTFYSQFSRPQHRRMIAVAGAIAEHVWDGELDFLRDEGEAVWWDAAIMSDTDWRHAGCEPGEPNAKLMGAVAKVIDLLAGPLRADLYAEARRLIVGFGRPAA